MHKRQLLYLSMILFIVFTGCNKGGYKSADEAKKKEQYWIAIEKYKQQYAAEKKDKVKKAQIAKEIGDLLLLNKSYRQAEGWYQKARAVGYTGSDLFYSIGEAYKMNEKYELAQKEFEQFLKENPGDKNGQDQVALMESVKDWVANPKSRFVVERFSRANSPENDFAPMLLKKESMYFTSDRPGGVSKGKQVYGRTGISYSDIYVIPRTATGKGDKKVYTWGTPSLVPGKINTIMNDGTASFDSKGQVMYFTQCNGKTGDSVKNCIIMEVKKMGKDWGEPEPLPFCVDTTVDYGHPTLSPDGQRLLFSADLPGGMGKHDIYMSTYVKRGKTWSDPVNLGEKINTPGEELFPYWLDDTTLYFASDGHIGLGGLDIFVTHGSNPDWSKPENLKYPLNSGGDDFAITFEEDRESGFFSSNRKESSGDDIYSFYMRPLIFTLKGVVKSTTGERMRNAKVMLEGMDDNSKIETYTNDTGGYFFTLGRETDYEVFATKKFYFPSAHKNKTTKGLTYSADLVQDLEIKTSKVDIEVPGIFYDLASADLRPESKRTLDSLVNVLNEIPYVTIELGSHTDCRASVKYNDSLSLARSNSTVNYLIKAGIEAERLVAKGYGETQLINNCNCEDGAGEGMNCTEDEHQANRRTTVKVLSYDYKSKNPANQEKKE